jgi:hypothetical protein
MANLAHRRAQSGCDLDGGASAVPAGGLANRPRAAPGHRPTGTMTGLRGARLTRDWRPRVTPAEASSQEARELELSRYWMRPVRRVPRWSAERRGGLALKPSGRAIAALVLRVFRRSASLHFREAAGRAFLQWLDHPSGAKARRENEIARIRPRDSGGGGPCERSEHGGGGV